MAHLGKKLKPLNLAFFWVGLVFYVTGTLLMATMTGSSQSGELLHGVTGLATILLMLFHATWVTVGLISYTVGAAIGRPPCLSGEAYDS